MRIEADRPRTTKNTLSVRIDRKKFSEYCDSIGHSEATLSAAYRGGSYLSKRFRLYDGKLPNDFIDWCNKLYPTQREKLEGCIIQETIPEKEPEKPKEEQMVLDDLLMPSVTKNKVVTVQPISLMGFNQLIEALNRISDRLEKLEEAWNGKHE